MLLTFAGLCTFFSALHFYRLKNREISSRQEDVQRAVPLREVLGSLPPVPESEHDLIAFKIFFVLIRYSFHSLFHMLLFILQLSVFRKISGI